MFAMEAPQPVDAASRARMVRQRRRDTQPELAIRSILHAHGFRYRVDAPVLGTRRRADLLFSRAKVAVFIDGCFWHGCPDHGTRPKANRVWWTEKIAANVARDRDTDRMLQGQGWAVVRVWAHQQPEDASQLIETVVKRARRVGLQAPNG